MRNNDINIYLFEEINLTKLNNEENWIISACKRHQSIIINEKYGFKQPRYVKMKKIPKKFIIDKSDNQLPKKPSKYVTREEFHRELSDLRTEMDQKFVTKKEFHEFRNEMNQKFVTKEEFHKGLHDLKTEMNQKFVTKDDFYHLLKSINDIKSQINQISNKLN